MDVVCWECEGDEFWLHYDEDGLKVQCISCGQTEVWA